MTAQLSKNERTELEGLITAYNQAVEMLDACVSQHLDGWRAGMDKQPEQWSESEEGMQAQDRFDILAEFSDEMPDKIHWNLDQISDAGL